MKKLCLVFLTAILLFASFGFAALAADEAPEIATHEELVAFIRDGLLARKSSFRFLYTGDDYRKPTVDELCAYGEDGAAGDYLRLSFKNSFPSVIKLFSGDVRTVVASYYTTAAQEAAVADYVAAAAAGCTETTEEGKARYVYDYLCENVSYDVENMFDETELMKYTAYGAAVNGKAVCQGYAQLYYRLALAVGLDCRIVTGARAGEKHAWNIVKIGGTWYHLDASCGAQLLDNSGYFKKPLFPLYTVSYENNDTAAEIADYAFPAPPAEATVETGRLSAGITWTLDKTTGLLEIFGSGAIPGSDPYSCFSFNRNIRSVVIYEGITTVGKNIFRECGDLQSVSIPASATTVHPEAFHRCYRLTSITVDARNPVYHSDGNCLIRTADKVLTVGAGGCVIPDDGSVETIGPVAFKGRNNLSSVVIPDCVTEIGREAFCESDVKTLRIPDSVTKLGFDAFGKCHKLETVSIGAGLSQIDGCELFGYPLGGGIVYSEQAPYAFHGCGKLRGVTVDENNAFFSSDERGAFFNKDKTVLIRYPAGNPAETYSVPDTVCHLGDAFYWTEYLKEVSIPGNVTAIGNDAFSNCYQLETVHFSEGLVHIGWDAFDSCIALTGITLPDSLRMIQFEAFRYCRALTSVVIPDGVTVIDEGAFGGCDHLTGVVVPESVTTVNAAFYGCPVLTIYGYTGSAAEAYAARWDIPFRQVCPVSNGLHRAEPAEATAATCTDGAYAAGERCADCGAWISGHEQTADPLGHDPAPAVRENVTEPTCTAEGGYDSVICCARCGAVLSSTPEKLAMTPHRDDDRNGCCDDCGANICGHGETERVNAITATCTTAGYSGDTVCRICGVTLVYGATTQPTGHSPVLHVSAQAATCLDPGHTEEYICSVCGAVTAAGKETSVGWHSDGDGDGLCDVCLSPTYCDRYGRCGDTLYWYIEAETLVISGSGDAWPAAEAAPWEVYRNAFNCVYVREGAGAVDGAAFNDCPRLTMVLVPEGASAAGCDRQVLTYSCAEGTVTLAGTGGPAACTVSDWLNAAYELCRDHEVRALRFDETRVLAPDGAAYTEYDILRGGKIIDENHFRLSPAAVLTDLTVRPVGYAGFNNVLAALGSHPDRNLILSLACGDLLPEELRREAEAYTAQLVVRFVDRPVNSGQQDDASHSLVERFKATLAAILALFKKIIKLFTKR